MAEDTPSNGATNSGAQPQQGPEFAIQKIYIKDLSFEAPNSPGVFLKKDWNGDTNVQLNTKARALNEQEGVYEVELDLTVTVTAQNETSYLVEVKQAGIFVARGFPPEQQGHLIGAYVPNLLFPFAREVVADLVMKGGFPQLLLQPINFDALYAQHQMKQAQEREATDPSSGPATA